MHEDELLAWALLGSGGVALILVYWAAVALEWIWRVIIGGSTRRKRVWRGGEF